MAEQEPIEIGVYIPPEILQLKDLNDRKKLILAAIVQLHKSSRECYASNDYFERWLGIPAKKVSEAINELAKETKLLKVTIRYKGKQVIRRDITPNLRALKISPKRRKGVSPKRGEGIPETG
jgi:hypothetical protein